MDLYIPKRNSIRVVADWACAQAIALVVGTVLIPLYFLGVFVFDHRSFWSSKDWTGVVVITTELLLFATILVELVFAGNWQGAILTYLAGGLIQYLVSLKWLLRP